MADQKLTDRTTQTALEDADLFATVDTSDLTDGSLGTSKKTLWSLVKTTLAALTENITGIKTFVNGFVTGTGASGVYNISKKFNTTEVAGFTNENNVLSINNAAASSGNYYVVNSRVDHESDEDGTSFVIGTNTSGQIKGLGRPNQVAGLQSTAAYGGTSASVQAGSLYAINAYVALSGGGYYNHIMGVKVPSPIINGGSTFGYNWGLYLSDQADAAAVDGTSAIHISGTGDGNAISFSNINNSETPQHKIYSNETDLIVETPTLNVDGNIRGNILIADSYLDLRTTNLAPNSDVEALYATGGNAVFQGGSSITISADNDGSGSGILNLKTKGISRATIDNDGLLNVSNDVYADGFKLNALNTAPATASATGTTGDIRWDANYMYVCVAANTWKRSSIATW